MGRKIEGKHVVEGAVPRGEQMIWREDRWHGYRQTNPKFSEDMLRSHGTFLNVMKIISRAKLVLFGKINGNWV